MSNDKYEATIHGGSTPPAPGVAKPGELWSPELPEGKHKIRKTPPLAARIAAGVIVGGLLVWGVVSCGAALSAGSQYQQCMEDARNAGLPDDEFTQRSCSE